MEGVKDLRLGIFITEFLMRNGRFLVDGIHSCYDYESSIRVKPSTIRKVGLVPNTPVSISQTQIS